MKFTILSTTSPCAQCGTSTNQGDELSNAICACCGLDLAKGPRKPALPRPPQAAPPVPLSRQHMSMAQKRAAVAQGIEHRARHGNEGLNMSRTLLYKWAKELGMEIPRLELAQYKTYKPRN